MKPIPLPTQFEALSPPWQLTQLDAFTNSVANAINDASTYNNYLIDGSSAANLITVATQTGITAPLVAGINIQVKVSNTNTGPTTLNLNGGGPVSVLNQDGSQLAPKQLVANGVYSFTFDGTVWQNQIVRSTVAAFTGAIAPFTVPNNGIGNTVAFNSPPQFDNDSWAQGSSTTITVPAGVTAINVYAVVELSASVVQGLFAPSLIIFKNGGAIVQSAAYTTCFSNNALIPAGCTLVSNAGIISTIPGDQYTVQVFVASPSTSSMLIQHGIFVARSLS